MQHILEIWQKPQNEIKGWSAQLDLPLWRVLLQIISSTKMFPEVGRLPKMR
jgi:hypothetical protein